MHAERLHTHPLLLPEGMAKRRFKMSHSKALIIAQALINVCKEPVKNTCIEII